MRAAPRKDGCVEGGGTKSGSTTTRHEDVFRTARAMNIRSTGRKPRFSRGVVSWMSAHSACAGGGSAGGGNPGGGADGGGKKGGSGGALGVWWLY